MESLSQNLCVVGRTGVVPFTFGCYDCPDVYFNDPKIKDYANMYFEGKTGVLMQGGKSVIGGQFRGVTVADLVNLNKDGYERYINHALDVIKYRRK